jgi:transcriptional regulator with XRE-family HTH domain
MSETTDRLRQALERSPHSIRSFHRKMEETGVEGSSYAACHRYLHGKNTPSLEFLREAARVLDVSEAWLILGRGDPSPERSAAEEAQARARASDAVDILEELIEDAFPAYADLPAHVRGAVLATWERLRADLRHRVLEEQERGREISLDEITQLVAAFVGNHLQHGFQAWSVEPGDLRGWQLEGYVLATCQALGHLIPDPNLIEDWTRGGS